jgi:curved DNA-binding protein CbpA
MAELPDYYFDLGVKPAAKPPEIDKTYARRVAELRASKVEDAPEELADVEAAYAILRDPSKRADYDRKLRAADDEEDKKDAEMNAYLRSSSRRHRHGSVRRSGGGVLGALLDLLSLFK